MAQEILRIVAGEASGTEITFDDVFTIGRSMTGDGALGGDLEISREHARLEHEADGRLVIRDLGSTNGTFVNGQRVNGPRALEPGDEISVGGTRIVVASPAPAGVGAVAGSAQATAMHATPGAGATRAMATPAAPPPAPPQAGTAPPAPPQVGTAPPAPPQVGTAPPAPPQVGTATGPLFGGGPPGVSAPPAKSRRSPLPFVLAILGAAIGIGIGALLWEGGASDEADVETLSLMAQGYSTESLDENTGQREINIFMTVFEGDHGIKELKVHKFLDETRPPPQRTYDAIYTFTATNEDTLVVRAAGDVTEPEGPDEFFGQTHEQWQVVEGTGIFENARGEGTITTAVHVAGRVGADGNPTGSNVVKHIEGEIQLPER